MPFPATHVLVNVALFYPLRSRLGRYWLIFAAFSGLLLDFDFVITWVSNWFGFNAGIFGHGGFFHTFGFILILAAISAIVFAKNKNWGKYGFILTVGAGVHLLLDYVLGGGAIALMLFYPFSTQLFQLHILFPLTQYDIFGVLDAFFIMLVLCWYYFKIKKSRLKHN